VQINEIRENADRMLRKLANLNRIQSNVCG